MERRFTTWTVNPKFGLRNNFLTPQTPNIIFNEIKDQLESGLLGVFRTVLVLCFRLPSSDPGTRFRPRRECDTLGLSEDEYDCISARSMRQYP